MWQIEFSSDKFLPVLPASCQVNPGVYGFELAWWLAQQLAGRGQITSYPVSEDWGWLIEYLDDEAEFMIGCSNLTNEGEGELGRPIQWSIFIRPHLSLKQRLKGVTHEAEVRRLGDHVLAVLRAESIAVTSPGD